MEIKKRVVPIGIGRGVSAMADTPAPARGEPADLSDVFARLGRERHGKTPQTAADESPATPSRKPLDPHVEARGGRASHRFAAIADIGEAAPSAPGPSVAEPASGRDEINPAQIIVWARENSIASDGKTATVGLSRTVHITDEGVKLELLHVSGSSLLSSVQNHHPFVGDSKVTDDAFDQAQAIQTAAVLYDRIAGFGVDLKSVFFDADNNDGVVRIVVNGSSESNAGFSETANAYTLGTSEGEFHLASCKDILVHELSHGYFAHIARGVNMDDVGEGRALHEAYSDLMAALHFGNANISEDIAAYLATKSKDPAKAPKALRTLANDAKLDSVGREPHDRSLVYSGLMWSVREKLAEKVGHDKACDLLMGAMAKLPFFVTNRSPSPEDIVRAFADGIRTHLGDLTNEVITMLHAEAVRRNIIPESVDLASQAPHAAAMAFQTAMAEVKERPVPAKALAGIARGLPELAKHGDIGFEVLGDRTAGDLRRVTLRALAQDDKTKSMVPVEDGLLDMVIVGDTVRAVAGGALSLPAFDFGRREVDAKGALATARRLTLKHLTEMAPHDKGADAVRKAFDTLFSEDNLETRRVLSMGHLCIALRTMGGEFVVDLVTGEVRPRRLMHIDALS